jgi:hypothetical protein
MDTPWRTESMTISAYPVVNHEQPLTSKPMGIVERKPLRYTASASVSGRTFKCNYIKQIIDLQQHEHLCNIVHCMFLTSRII